MDLDREQKALEEACKEACAIMERLQPGSSSRPKDFMTYHDAWLVHEAATARLVRFREERVRLEMAPPSRP